MLEKRRWIVHDGPPIFDEDPNDCCEVELNSVWWDLYIDTVREDHDPLFDSSDEEPSGQELWINSLDVHEYQVYEDPFDDDNGTFEQGEWIFNHERKFFENKNACSNNNERDKCVDCGLMADLKMAESAVEDDDIKEDQFGLDNEECCTAENVRWKTKKNVRSRIIFKWRSEEGICLRSSNVDINSMKRTHYQSGKKTRGRNRPSFI